MDRLTRWETEALRRRGNRPRPRSRTIDLRDAAAHERSNDPEPAEPPPGTLLVPLDAWQRMLDQLGNLHEAGQQLADASARAARAETETEFLRERVAELRRQLADSEADEASTNDASAGDEADPKTETNRDESARSERSLVVIAAARARSAYHDLRRRRRR